VRPCDPACGRRPLAGILIVALLLAGCSRSPTGASATAKPEVERAYLSWWSARQAAYLRLDPSPLKGYATPAGLRADVQRMADLRAAGHLLQLSAEHAMQTVVFRDGATASVDDVWADHSVELDPSTLSPIQPDPDVTLHDSTTLRRRGGRWVVDGVFHFGSSHELPRESVSYAAVTGGRPLPDFYRRPIADAYEDAYEKGTRKEAKVVEHNERVAIAQDSVAWVYDTTADGSSVAHTTTRLTQTSGVWMVQPDS
jgi:hypothetical protein